MKQLCSFAAWTQPSICLLSASAIASAIVAVALDASPVVAQSTTLPASPNLIFQTSGPARCSGVGDWYTSNGGPIPPAPTPQTPPGVQNAPGPVPPQPFPTNLCVLGDPTLNPTTNPIANRLHRYFINITAEDLANAPGNQITVTIEDAETGGPLDEVDGSLIATNTSAFFDPTRFQLIDPAGSVLASITRTPPAGVPGVPLPSVDVTFGAVITQPGSYTVTSVTGEFAVNGYAGPFNPNLNNDDNGFRIRVNGAANLLIGQFQGTAQNAMMGANTYPFYLLAGPDAGSLFLRNFDLDGEGPVTYISPTGTSINGGLVSTNGFWNNGGDLNTGGDTVPVAGLANAGRWTFQLNNYGSFINQTLLQANNGTTGDRLPLFEVPPTRAGNVVIERAATAPFTSNGAVCYAFTVRNLFFTSDIINLDFNPNDPNITSQFRDANGQNPLADTDGDGRPDTGILRSNESRTYTVCVTAGPNAPPQFDFNIGGLSFMDARIRQQAGNTPATRQSSLSFNFGGQVATATSSLRLVKRITSITRNGASLPGVNFGVFVNNPETTEDDDPGWAQTQLLGILSLPVDNPVRSGDEITYTVYFLAGGSSPLLDTSICDQIPGGTSFIPGSLQLSQANLAPRSAGEFFTPLAPLPDNNSCAVQTNPNGSTVTNLGTVSNTPGSNFGFTRFRVRVN